MAYLISFNYTIDNEMPDFDNCISERHPLDWLSEMNQNSNHVHYVLINFWPINDNLLINDLSKYYDYY